MSLEIRPLPADQLRNYLELVENAGGGSIDDEAWPHIAGTMEPDRALGAYDGARLVGGGAAYSFDFTVPGGHAPTAGVTWVGVLPTHRRAAYCAR